MDIKRTIIGLTVSTVIGLGIGALASCTANAAGIRAMQDAMSLCAIQNSFLPAVVIDRDRGAPENLEMLTARLAPNKALGTLEVFTIDYVYRHGDWSAGELLTFWGCQ